LRGIVPQGPRQGTALQEHQHPLRSSPVIPKRPTSSPSRGGNSEAVQSARNNQVPSPSVRLILFMQ
jgi:hypothetical protein